MSKITSQRRELFFGYRSFWPEFAAMERFKHAGVETVTLFAANTVGNYARVRQSVSAPNAKVSRPISRRNIPVRITFTVQAEKGTESSAPRQSHGASCQSIPLGLYQ